MIQRIAAGVVSCTAALFFGATLAHALLNSPVEDVSESTHAPRAREALPGNYPERLIIPSIGVDAHIQDVGITKKKTMAVPTNYTDAGWYRHGPLPGEEGSAVIAGHVDNALKLPGVFKRLEDLSVGADVYVRTVNGELVHFVVEDMETYSVDDVPEEKIFGVKSSPRLNLVTCKGDWVQSERQYDHRFVVYTRLVD